MTGAGISVLLAEAEGWSSQTEICVVLILGGFLLAFIGHAGGDGGFNWGIALGWALMVGGFVALGL